MENNTWKLILKNLAVPIKKCASNDSPLAYPLTSFAILKVTGDDRYLFLQNQFTNDLENEKKIVQLSAWCNPKGKIITNFIVINTGENYLLIFKKNIKDYVYKKLNMYILRSKVKIDDISSSCLLLGLSNITQLKLDQTTISLDNIIMENINEKFIVRLPNSSNRYLLVTDNKTMEDVVSKLKNTIEFQDDSNWEQLDIISGIPWINSESKEKYLPQMINLDKLKAVSFKKGCYTGQEVIAKLHYRGTVKRTMKIISSENKLYVGKNLYMENSEKKVGEILNSSSYKYDGIFFSLAVIETDKLSNDLFSDTLSKEKVSII